MNTHSRTDRHRRHAAAAILVVLAISTDLIDILDIRLGRLSESIVPTVITANRLADGIVVFLDRGNAWVASIAHAAAYPSGQEGDALARAKEDEERQVIVEPYAIEVTDRGGQIVPKALREAIRANGPTVRRDLAAGARS